MTQVFANHNQSSTTPFTTACFACATFSASALSLIRTLNARALGVLIICVAVLLIGLISLIIRLVHLPPNQDTERA